MENFITIHKYAALHRQSVHSVIKKTMNGELPCIEKEENGKKVIYVRYDAAAPAPKKEETAISEEEIDHQAAYEALHKEYLVLQTKYKKLVEMLEEGNLQIQT